MNIKILIVCSSLGGGGAEKVAANLASAFSGLGHDVTVFCRPCKKQYPVDSRVRIIHPSKRMVVSRIISLASLVRSKSPDFILSFTDVSNVDAWFASKIAGYSGVRVPTIHNDLKLRDSRVKASLKKSIVYYLHRLACLSASRVVVVSKSAAVSFCDYYKIDVKKVSCIYNPVISDNFNLLPAVSQNSLKKQIRLVAVGRLVDQKNYPLMIDVMETLCRDQVHEFTLDIYGEGELEGELKRCVEQKALTDVVTFRGFSSDLDKVLPEYDCFILTSDWEGFGNVLVEALACGLPVVSTACPSGPEEVLGWGRFGTLVEPANSKLFADAVLHTINQPKDVDRCELNQHLHQFRESVIAQHYLDVFSTC
ncbi:glycosyltransferase [Alcanivorax sp.]|uniref:glycosyltransferase n=1 Tax=Alcanivorax sp. TaxID=1872427 RepID=UPI0025BD90DE|nr:glycosyltransferase [Alcanivorax sp.]